MLNESALAMGVTPIKRRQMRRSKRYRRHKLRKVLDTIESKVSDLDPNIRDAPAGSLSEKAGYFEEIMEQLKAKFTASDKPSDKIKILTVMPASWSIRKLTEEFGATYHQARCAKAIQTASGCLSETNPKPGKVLNPETAALVKTFYRSDQVSRVMPGKKDFVSVRNKTSGKRDQVQKRLILCNLKEAYRLFKDTHPTHKIGFSKFAELRPLECMLAGVSVIHSVCVCKLHENTKLMMDGGKITDVVIDGVQMSTYHHCLSQIQ